MTFMIDVIGRHVGVANGGKGLILMNEIYAILVQLAEQITQASSQEQAIEEICQIYKQVITYPFGSVSKALFHLGEQVESGDNVADIIKQIIQERSSGENILQSIVNAATTDSEEDDEENKVHKLFSARHCS
jgi:hypothetical protein